MAKEKDYTLEELQKMVAKKKRERSDELYKARVKRQNERAKEIYDIVSCRFPKGMKEEIKSRGETINGLINKLVAEWLVEQIRIEEEKVDSEADLF